MSDWFRRFSNAQLTGIVGVFSAAAVITTWWFRYVQDDAFITFRYAQNFANGDGLVLNPGERVEGYTNFLWTVLMALPEKQGWSTPTFSLLVTLVLLVAAIYVSYAFSTLVLGDRPKAVLATAVLVANMSFVGYGSGGLETMLQTFLVMTVAWLLIETDGRSNATVRRLAAGVVGGVAVLVRMDSAVLVGTWFLISLWSAWKAEPTDNRIVRSVGAAALMGVPVVAIITPWLVWKYDYYGSIVPNTQAAKDAGFLIPFLFGIFYLLFFLVRYLGVLLLKRFARERREFFSMPTARQAFIPVGVWCFYICFVGGDFMEYRFLVPIIPILAILASVLLDRFSNLRSQVVLCVVLLMASGVTMIAPTVFPYPTLTFSELRHWPTSSKTTWVGIGTHLNETFPGGLHEPGQPTIAVEALGALSYYSELPTIDMLGLADREIANDGLQISPYYPGHVRVATIEQLLEKDVNLILGLPKFWRIEDRRPIRMSELADMYATEDLKKLPDDATMVFFEIANGRTVGMIYLQPNDKVDAMIESGEWWTEPIEMVCDDADLNFVTKMTAKDTCEGLER